jgi:hypothetical protein
MRKLITVSAIGLGLLLGQVLPTSADVPDGVTELSGDSVAAGIGFSRGSGTLISPGQALSAKGQRLLVGQRWCHRLHRGGKCDGSADGAGHYSVVGN